MCQECVTAGFLTQEQLDARILSGDTSVMPLMDLPLDQALRSLAVMVVRGDISMDEAEDSARWLAERDADRNA